MSTRNLWETPAQAAGPGPDLSTVAPLTCIPEALAHDGRFDSEYDINTQEYDLSTWFRPGGPCGPRSS